DEVQRYLVPLALVPYDDDRLTPALAVVEVHGQTHALVDATQTAEFRQWLAQTMELHSEARSIDGNWIARSAGGDNGSEPLRVSELSSRVMPGEQSNTSILYGELAILKLYRRLQAG